MLAVATGTMVAYGWVIERAVHPAVPLVLQFMQGLWGTFFYTTYSTLLVDVYPDKSSTAAAATSGRIGWSMTAMIRKSNWLPPRSGKFAASG